MSGYQHLSKAGSRFLKQVERRPKHLVDHFKKFEEKSMPSFLVPSIPRVENDQKFQSVREWVFMPGDRVVITRGRWKGQISVIQQHDKETNGFILDENGPTKTVPVPKQFWSEGQNSHMVTFPIAVEKKDLKLVADIDDPAAPGQTKTVAVRDIVFKGSYFDENYKQRMPFRCVSGQEDLVIPWPRPEPKADAELATPAEVAREQTFWVESIAKNPIPEGALLTVRNPHSKWRRGTLSARDIAKLVAPKMPLTKTKKAYIAEQKELAAAPRRKLTSEDKELIGSKIFQHLKQHL
ncbi:mitochondrial 54S ribosomal protein uL24m [Lachancea thermotolerans CBS 6340]|uniref:KLTH0D11946p n=1 Tax=Lachancea thermotolerans (strain ATCC 56472 / CBS 6340 / NRRL Y-8284) TaxID=559295 RepID=C5DF37_LACTC|nr:mitochondrial 54S ribosomal protein YmL40 [Lachancea thermotolerans CBS 6340]CAR22792.1 KLTH0D11946p [Lachancea thermotolerans CBS 6340]